MRLKCFASLEALLSLVFASFAFSLLLPLFSYAPPAFSLLHQKQLAEDFAEITLAKSEFFEAVLELAEGDGNAERFLEGEYSRVALLLGDYCVELRAKESVARANCKNPLSSRVSASRMVFDGSRFFELAVSVGLNG